MTRALAVGMFATLFIIAVPFLFILGIIAYIVISMLTGILGG